MSNKIKDKDDQLFSNSLNTPLNKISNEELINKINFKKKISIIILIASIIIIIIYLIIISQYANEKEGEKEKPKIKTKTNKIIAKLEVKTVYYNINLMNERYEDVDEYIESMKLNGETINNTQFYSFYIPGNYTLEINFKKPLNSTEEMFENCYELTEIDLTQLNFENIINMTDMFYGCFNLKSINVNNIDAPKLKNISGMFRKCTSLTSINLSSFKANKLEDI